ncbi:hypothetical protein WJX73_009132 [Symbiochloris irregularis]|uniref:F-box domain-containing protein n=1 Tax=Symbiochloris irregularis TaxID=706552 RepID=A0AAW1NNZ5_9CHLO
MLCKSVAYSHTTAFAARRPGDSGSPRFNPQEGRQRCRELFASPELQSVLAIQVLPALALPDLAAAACTCKALRSLVYEQSYLWPLAAAAYLPPQHPSLTGKDRLAVQQVMQRRLDIKRRTINGRSSRPRPAHLDPSYLGSFQMIYSACGTRLALAQDTRIGLCKVPEGTALFTQDYEHLDIPFGTFKFDRTGAFFGFSFKTAETRTSALVCSTASGQPILKSDASNFITFFTSARQALIENERCGTFEVWDLVQQTLLYAIACKAHFNLSLIMDDAFIMGFDELEELGICCGPVMGITAGDSMMLQAQTWVQMGSL